MHRDIHRNFLKPHDASSIFFRGDDIAMLDQRHDASCCGPVAAWMRLPRSPLSDTGHRVGASTAASPPRQTAKTNCQQDVSARSRHRTDGTILFRTSIMRDECWEWANKAEALASYAKMADDDSLRIMADRIQARAVRRIADSKRTSR